MSKEEIMTTIQGLANKLGRVPTLTELKTMTPVTLLQSEFPDCEALRQVMRDKWQRLRIEFEYESLNFLKHGHDVKGCDMIVCWKHNWPECPLEVLELSKFVGRDRVIG